MEESLVPIISEAHRLLHFEWFNFFQLCDLIICFVPKLDCAGFMSHATKRLD